MAAGLGISGPCTSPLTPRVLSSTPRARSFGGFGALTRHLGRLSGAVEEALAVDMLDARSLALLNAYNPGLSGAWMLQVGRRALLCCWGRLGECAVGGVRTSANRLLLAPCPPLHLPPSLARSAQ